MWPFSAPRNPYYETIAAKCARRADAIELAPFFNPEKHQKYLNATGNHTVLHIVLFMLRLALCFTRPHSVQLIIFWSASEIVENIQHRTWTASAVLEAYIARAAQAHRATNCFTEGTSAPH